MMHFPPIIAYVFAAGCVWSLMIFIYGTIKANRYFQEDGSSPAVFIERYASGYSMKNLVTRLSGAHSALEISVRHSEIWIRGIFPIFSYVGFYYDLTHRIVIDRVSRIEIAGAMLHLHFTDAKDISHEVHLQLKNPTGLIQAVQNSRMASDAVFNAGPTMKCENQ